MTYRLLEVQISPGIFILGDFFCLVFQLGPYVALVSLHFNSSKKKNKKKTVEGANHYNDVNDAFKDPAKINPLSTTGNTGQQL